MAVKLQKLRIGTRGSPLALRQAEMVRAALARVQPGLETEIVVIKTSGDWKPSDGEVRLEESAGGKGQFAKEIEAALLAGDIDCGVHSMKDMEARLPDGLEISHMLPREDVRDALLSRQGLSLEQLPQGAVVGTASVRRQAFLLRTRPDLKVVPFRGNVQTRIEKMKAGQVDATLLAIAGLKRLGLEKEATEILPDSQFLPSAGQGAVGIECRSADSEFLAIFSQFSCSETVICVQSERAAVAVLEGTCHTPIGALGTLKDGQLSLRVSVVKLDGSEVWFDQISAPVSTVQEAIAVGEMLGQRLKKAVPAGVLL